MYKKSEEELNKALIAKAHRSITRLKYSLQADREINDTLPDLLLEYDKSLSQGQLLALPEGWAEEAFDEVTS